jgi:serine O-acetyltransferase
MKLFSGIYWGRLSEQMTNPIFKHMAAFVSRWLLMRRGVEITFNGNIGDGLVLGHAFGITVNRRAKIGHNCVLFKGCTIGSVRSGKREGVPILGNRVVVGCNAFVCGGITIGDDVLIGANAFVDFDVPPNSIVIGNPGQIHHKESPCIDYVVPHND